MSASYDKIERAYGPHLERDADSLLPDATAQEASVGVPSEGDGAGTTAPTGGGGGGDTVIKNESQVADLWIQNTIKSLNWKPKTKGFYIDGATGYAEFADIFLAGGITATTGSIGGWTIEANQLSSGNVKIQSLEERILMGAATAPGTGIGIFMGKDGADYKFRVGDPSGASFQWNGSSLTFNGGILTGLGSGTDLALLGWQFDAVFSATNQTTVAWGAGTLRFQNGVTHAISGANTGVMAALTYIYFDSAVSTSVLQTTTTASNAVGGNKVLIAVAKNNSESGKDATFQVFGGAGGVNPFISADNIAANSITANEIAANTITASQIAANTITASQLATTLLYAGAITLDTNGHIKGGQSAYDTGTGFFLGYSGGQFKLSLGVGGQLDDNLRWDGSRLIINGYEQTGLGTYGGDGSDGALNVVGTTTLNAGQLYQYTSITIGAGATLNFTGNGIATILCSGNVTIDPTATIELRFATTAKIGGVVGVQSLESSDGYVAQTLGEPGAGGNQGGSAGAGGDGASGTGAGAGTGGAGGVGANVDGADGTVGTTNTTGGGGGGGGSSQNGVSGTNGSNASGMNGGNGGNGGKGGTRNGDGGGGGAGTGIGNGGAGGTGGTAGSQNVGHGGAGGDSGLFGGDGGNGGNGSIGGRGGDGYVNGGRGGDGLPSNNDAGDGGNGGDGRTGNGGDGGDGGDGTTSGNSGAGGEAGNGGNGGITGGNGGNGGDAWSGDNNAGANGGTGGNGNSGAVPLYIFASGDVTLDGTINGQGGDGGDGGDGGVGGNDGNGGPCGSGGSGGDGGAGVDVFILCRGTFTNNGITINNRGGRGGRGGEGATNSPDNGINPALFGSRGRDGRDGRDGRVIIGRLTI